MWSAELPPWTRRGQRLETRHVDAEKPAFRTRLPPILTFSTHYQTGWNVTKWHACHAKRHDNLLGHIRMRGFPASPIDTAKPRENQRLETRHVGAPKRAFRARRPPISHFVASKSTFSYEFSLEPENLQPQNRCFVRGFRQFSAHRACHGICTLSPLDAALPMRFAKNTQHDTSKVLRLPRKMTMDTSKVLRLPRKMQHIF